MAFAIWKRNDDTATLYGGGDSGETCKDYQRDLSPDEVVNGVPIRDLEPGWYEVRPESLQALLR